MLRNGLLEFIPMEIIFTHERKVQKQELKPNRLCRNIGAVQKTHNIGAGLPLKCFMTQLLLSLVL